MRQKRFELVPFPDLEIPDIKITGNVFRDGNLLTVQYSLSGKIEQVLFPNVHPRPGRKDKLWLVTCFEFFLALPGQPQYWEFNLSPAGDWNAFHMDAYRRIGFRQEESIQNPEIKLANDIDCFKLDATIDLDPIFTSETKIQAAVTSVIQTRQGHETYWALVHPQPQADFHLRESFLLTL
jgi:hypothetical protein